MTVDYEVLFGKPPKEYRCCHNCCRGGCDSDFNDRCDEWEWGGVTTEDYCGSCRHVRIKASIWPCFGCINTEGKPGWRSW